MLTWSTVAMDRHRVRDRMRELRIAPWSDATGDGLDIRVAAAHAALGRLVEATGAAADPAPDLVVASGGVWSAMPTSLVAMTLADLLRRPGASQVAFDHASLLAPIGSIPDDSERRAVLVDLLDDLLVPLGTLVMPSGLRSGRPAGRLIVHDGTLASVTELSHGELTRVALAPGAAAVAEFRFRDTVRLGGRGRVFAIDVAGGSTGVLVDLRDVPLRLPDRADSRREQLRAWQQLGRTGGPGMSAMRLDTDLGLVPVRRLVESPVDAVFELSPGDRPLVEAGESVVVGAPIAERLRDARLEEVAIQSSSDPTPGARWSRDGGSGPAGVRHTVDGGELLFTWRGKWRMATGDVPDPLEAPVAGIVRDVKPGTSLTLRATGQAIRGIVVLGGPTRGRLHLAAGASGGLRPGGLDVGFAGTILVVGTRVDAETLTRARAMGIRGIVVAGLASKERRDFLASEARQRAALHRLPPYAVLVMDGATRRPMAGPLDGHLRDACRPGGGDHRRPTGSRVRRGGRGVADPAGRLRAHPRRCAARA